MSDAWTLLECDGPILSLLPPPRLIHLINLTLGSERVFASHPRDDNNIVSTAIPFNNLTCSVFDAPSDVYAREVVEGDTFQQWLSLVTFAMVVEKCGTHSNTCNILCVEVVPTTKSNCSTPTLSLFLRIDDGNHKVQLRLPEKR